ncbi:MAG: hypothetical protein JST54_26470 [Deltaproteobacteria bacterium]|nr:hypothetical protein [Deltaproteobacteria bacterium]
MSEPAPAPKPSAAEENGDLFDYALIRDWLGYALGSTLRHPLIAIIVAALVMCTTIGALKVLPRSYHVESKLLAQRNTVMNALDNPNRSWGEGDAPLRAASETVLRRDNLVLLIKQTDLVDTWERTRAPAVRLKDRVLELINGPPTDDDRIDALVGLLEKRLTVETGDQTVTISLDWPDGNTAFRLVDAAQQNFLEARHVTEIALISEAISILEGHATQVHEAVMSTMDELQQRMKAADAADDKDKPPDSAPKPAKARAPTRRPEDQEVAQLKVLLSSKKQTIKDVEEFRQRRLTELQTQLTEAKAIYAPAHPTVLNIQQTIDALTQPSPQVEQLQREAKDLEDELDRRVTHLDGIQEPSRKDIDDAIKLSRKAPSDTEDVNLEYTRSRLRLAVSQYDTLLERIDAAHIELDTARAAFKYRYAVIRPAQVPKKPQKPNAGSVLFAGALAALALAQLAALLADLRGGRIVQRWQVERLLELPVLGEVRRA